jgi:hypothetical protein
MQRTGRVAPRPLPAPIAVQCCDTRPRIARSGADDPASAPRSSGGGADPAAARLEMAQRQSQPQTGEHAMAWNGDDARSEAGFTDDSSAAQERSRSAAASGREAQRGESRGEGRGESWSDSREDSRDDAREASSDDRSRGDDAELENEIRQRAHERWLARGDAPGSDVDDWCCAERDVREARASRGRSESRTESRSESRSDA